MARTTTTAPPPAAQTGRGANFLSLTVENVRCFGPAQTLDLSDGYGRPWMHPRWQRQIVAYLTERCPNTQFIVTAHSPLVVQAAADANIVLLRREGDHVVIDNDPEVMSNWRVDQILTSELFGLDSARPPRIEAPLKERCALLAKPALTSRDRARLAELEAQIGELPAGERAEDRRSMELIRRAAEKLQDGA